MPVNSNPLEPTQNFVQKPWLCGDCRTEHYGNCPKMQVTLTTSSAPQNNTHSQCPICKELVDVMEHEHPEPENNTQLDELKSCELKGCLNAALIDHVGIGICTMHNVHLKTVREAWNKATVIEARIDEVAKSQARLYEQPVTPRNRTLFNAIGQSSRDRIAALKSKQEEQK